MNSDLFVNSNELKKLVNNTIGSLESSMFCTNVNYQKGVGELHILLNEKKEALSKILGDKDTEKAILKEALDLIDDFNSIPMSAFK